MIDYSQYAGQNQAQQYKQPQVVQQQVQTASPRKPSVQFSPPPPQPSYNTVQQDVYSQSQDYSDNYSIQVTYYLHTTFKILCEGPLQIAQILRLLFLFFIKTTLNNVLIPKNTFANCENWYLLVFNLKYTFAISINIIIL